jgi:hypothetical protein
MYTFGWTVARLVYGMTWKAVQKAYPKVSKKVFNQIKKYKNKKELKKSFDKKEGVKPKVKKKTTTTTTSKVAPTTVSTAKKISDIAKTPFKGGTAEIKAIDKLLGNIPSTAIKYAWQHPIQTGVGGYAATKAVSIGSKLFKGRAITDTGKGENIQEEITGNGVKPKGPPLSGGAEGLNNFVNAHNEALASGKSHFVFQGKHFNVGKTQLSQF